MTGTHGGARPGAGRPKGTTGRRIRPKRVLAALRRHRREGREAAANAQERAGRWLLQYEDVILDDLIASGEPKILLEVWKVMKRYGDGEPVSRVQIESGPSPAAILMEILRERRERATLPAPPIETHTVPPAGDDRPS